jgi:RNA polymerase sigma-70 factor (ECF subfamily)
MDSESAAPSIENKSGKAHMNVSSSDSDYKQLSDEELMRRLFHKDKRAFEAIFDRYGDLVYSTALRVLRDAHLAQDVSQEIFVRLWRKPESYVAERGRFLTWLISVTRNRAVDEIRSRGRRLRHETASPEEQEREIPAGEANDPALNAQLAEQARTVRAALAELPPEQRQVIELAYFGGLTQQEISDRLDQPLGTVKTRIRLGMQKLRAALAPEMRSERI